VQVSKKEKNMCVREGEGEGEGERERKRIRECVREFVNV